jgi:hypothetical protein
MCHRTKRLWPHALILGSKNQCLTRYLLLFGSGKKILTSCGLHITIIICILLAVAVDKLGKFSLANEN